RRADSRWEGHPDCCDVQLCFGGQPIMRAARRASLLVAFFLLASAATTIAECAWVFWQEFTGPPTYESSLVTVSAWETKQACEQALAKKVSSDTESSRKDKDNNVTVDHMAGKPRVSVQSKDRPDLIRTSTYVCIPDTVDPRGPKAK